MLREFRTLAPYFRRYLYRYLLGLLCLVLADGGQLYIPQLVSRAVDLIASGAFSLGGILALSGQMIASALVIVGSRFGWRYFIQGSARRIELGLRQELFYHLQTLSSTFYGRAKTGDLMSHFTNDMDAIRMACGMAIVSFVDGVFMTLAILVILVSRNPVLTLLSISPLPLITAGVIAFGKAVGERFLKVQEGFSKLSEMAQESISGIRVLKTFVQEKAFVQRFTAANTDYSERNMDLVRLWGFFYPLVAFLGGLTSMIFLFLGGGAVIDGRLSPGQFTAFFSYLGMLIWPMLGAGFTINILQRAGASLGRVNRILEEKPDIASPPGASRAKIRGAVSIRNLSYTYPGSSQPVLSGIQLEIPAGSSLGFLGRTASGKSTLARLLPRVLDPPPGTVFIDGRDVRSLDLATLRQSIGMVPQDSFLFSATIRENIAFGSRDVGERVRRAAQISTIDRDWAGFPLGWDTVVGERGITLSGGQKQRVALSRALATDAALYIMDDSFSAVDTETEDAILRQMLPYLRGRTLILISHRISTLKMAERIVVLEGGRIAQQGSHEELLAQEGFYAEIYALQQLEETLERKG